jgi:hypothetical protein
MHTRRLATLLVSGLLVLTAAAPVAAVDTGTVYVHVQIQGYTVQPGAVGGELHCGGMPAVGFGLEPGNTESTSGPFVVPAGSCGIRNVGLGDAGDLGEWGPVYVTPDTNVAAGGTFTFEVTVQLLYNGNQPQWDVYGYIPMKTLSADRVLVKSTGAITVSGSIWCPEYRYWPFGDAAFVNVDWDATQYVGRKTAIHGSYRSDIATICYDPATPTKPLTWETRSGANNGQIRWVFGTDGRFGSGTIIVEPSSGFEMTQVTQWWDDGRPDYSASCKPTPPTGDPNPTGYAFYDSNGDGFCAYDAFLYGRTQWTVRTTLVKSR